METPVAEETSTQEGRQYNQRLCNSRDSRGITAVRTHQQQALYHHERLAEQHGMPATAGTLEPVRKKRSRRDFNNSRDANNSMNARIAGNISCRRDVNSSRDGGHSSDSRDVNSSKNKISSRDASNIIDHDNS
jgi:hypothetical protein